MGKKVREYKSGDFIFAKVKGYPAWPARVQRLNGKKYFVYFYGTRETANLPPNMIFDYAENKDKFLTKTVKRRDFNDGVKQIEYDFANNVPLEQVIGTVTEPPPEANDTANDTVNTTMDDSVADTTAADETVEESAGNTTQNDTVVEDSDDAGPLVIDEGKGGMKSPSEFDLHINELIVELNGRKNGCVDDKGKKNNPAKTPAKETPKGKEPKTPKGRAKKEESKEEEESKKEEEIISRSGRKIRPKRYIDEQTEDNATLPSPVPKKRKAATPPPAQDKDGDTKEKEINKDKPAAKLYNAVRQSELEDLKEPFKQENAEKDNILIAYLPSGMYVGVKLFQSRPSSFKNDAARLAWYKQSASNSVTLKQQLEKGQITPQSITAQLVMDLNLTDEEKASLDKERETEEKKSRVQFLKTEMKLIELDAKIKTCLCLEKADTDLCLKLLDELMELEVKPLMLLKHPSCLETVKRMRAYVGNTPSWDLSEEAAIQFNKQAHKIRKQADSLYTHMKTLFTTPEGLSFWEFFSERVLHFKKVTAALSADELLELVHEPLEMSQPTAHTMKTAIEAANEQEPTQNEDEVKDKKKSTPVKSKKTTNSTPSKPATKRQSSRNKQQEEKEAKKSDAEDKPEDQSKIEDATEKAPEKDKEETPVDNEASKESNEAEKEKQLNKEDTPSTTTGKENTESTTKQDSVNENNVTEKEKEKTAKATEENSSTESKSETKASEATDKETASEDKLKPNDKKEGSDKSQEDKQVSESKEDAEKDKDVAEPRAKRSRESKKTEPPPSRSPAKRKSKF